MRLAFDFVKEGIVSEEEVDEMTRIAKEVWRSEEHTSELQSQFRI